jgi:hypothetical protein
MQLAEGMEEGSFLTTIFAKTGEEWLRKKHSKILYCTVNMTSVLHLRPPEKIRAFFETTVPEFINPVFAKTSPKRSHSIIENERFRLVFARKKKTGSLNSGTVLYVEISNGYNKFTLENDNKKRLKVNFWVNIRNVKKYSYSSQVCITTLHVFWYGIAFYFCCNSSTVCYRLA